MNYYVVTATKSDGIKFSVGVSADTPREARAKFRRKIAGITLNHTAPLKVKKSSWV